MEGRISIASSSTSYRSALAREVSGEGNISLAVHDVSLRVGATRTNNNQVCLRSFSVIQALGRQQIMDRGVQTSEMIAARNTWSGGAGETSKRSDPGKRQRVSFVVKVAIFNGRRRG